MVCTLTANDSFVIIKIKRGIENLWVDCVKEGKVSNYRYFSKGITKSQDKTRGLYGNSRRGKR